MAKLIKGRAPADNDWSLAGTPGAESAQLLILPLADFIKRPVAVCRCGGIGIGPIHASQNRVHDVAAILHAAGRIHSIGNSQ